MDLPRRSTDRARNLGKWSFSERPSGPSRWDIFQYVPPRLRRSFCREVRDAIRKRVRRAQVVDGFVYSQILIAAQNPSGQLFAASEKPRRDLVPESNMLFIGAAASRGTSGLMVNVPTLTRVGVKWTPGLRARGSMIVTARRA